MLLYEYEIKVYCKFLSLMNWCLLERFFFVRIIVYTVDCNGIVTSITVLFAEESDYCPQISVSIVCRSVCDQPELHRLLSIVATLWCDHSLSDDSVTLCVTLCLRL